MCHLAGLESHLEGNLLKLMACKFSSLLFGHVVKLSVERTKHNEWNSRNSLLGM